jgi:hypothetical protein
VILPVRQTGAEQNGWVAGGTFSSKRVEAAATLRPDCPEQGSVPRGAVGEGRSTSLWGRVEEKSPGLVVGHLSRTLEQYGRAGVKTFSSGLRAEEPGPGQ